MINLLGFLFLWSCTLCASDSSGGNGGGNTLKFGNKVHHLCIIYTVAHHLCIKCYTLSPRHNINQSFTTPFVQYVVLLGDWGKGGIYGDILAPTFAPTPSPTFQATATTTGSPTASGRRLKDDNKDGGGGGGGGGGEDSVTYTYQVAVSKALGSWASTNTPDFVIALGDNFYTDGVASTSDAMWSTHWKQVYLGYSNLNIPWFPVFGNTHCCCCCCCSSSSPSRPYSFSYSYQIK